jgi:hypothetical protein
MQYFIRVLNNTTAGPRFIARAHICAAMILIDINAWQKGKYTPSEKEVFAVGYHYNEGRETGLREVCGVAKLCASLVSSASGSQAVVLVDCDMG